MKISVQEKFNYAKQHGFVRNIEIAEDGNSIEVTEVHEPVEQDKVLPGYCRVTRIPKSTMEKFISLYIQKMKGLNNEIQD